MEATTPQRSPDAGATPGSGTVRRCCASRGRRASKDCSGSSMPYTVSRRSGDCPGSCTWWKSEDDLPLELVLHHVTQGGTRLLERVRPIEDRRDLSFFQEPPQHLHRLFPARRENASTAELRR